MAFKHILIVGSVLAGFLVTNTAWGQVDVPSPRFKYKQVEKTENTRPYATPGVFDYDTQMFAPIEFSTGEELEPNNGFFASFDKTYTSVSRAGHFSGGNESASPTGNDYIWGERYEMGWMTEADDGWAIAFQQSEGTYYAFGQDSLVTNPEVVVTDIAHVEINKIFRQELDRGGYFEPYIGGRFISVSDNTIEDTIIGTAANRFKQNVTNNVFGLQAGARYNQRHGRWRTTCDGAIATTYNQQSYFATDLLFPVTGGIQISETYSTDQAFVPVIDFQLETAYHISRDLAFRTGVQAIWLWDGIARANTKTTLLNPNSVNATVSTDGAGLFDNDLVSAGFLFGLEWRR